MNLKIYLLFLLFVLSQCTIQKRLHSDGYTILWNKKTTLKNPTSENAKEIVLETAETYESKVLSKDSLNDPNSDDQEKKQSTQKSSISLNQGSNIKNVFLENKNDKNNCGTIILSNGKRILYSKIKSAGNTIEYIKCDSEKDNWSFIDAEEVEEVRDSKDVLVPLNYDKDGELYPIETKSQNYNKDEQVTEGLGFLALALCLFISGIAGLLVAISSRKIIAKNPERYKNKWVTELAYYLSLARIIFTLLVLAILLIAIFSV